MIDRKNKLADFAREVIINDIHGDVDRELVQSLGEWAEGRKVNVSVLEASVAYWLAHMIYEFTDDVAEGCIMAASFETYIHHIVHRLYETCPKSPLDDGPPEKSEKIH